MQLSAMDTARCKQTTWQQDLMLALQVTAIYSTQIAACLLCMCAPHHLYHLTHFNICTLLYHCLFTCLLTSS